MKTINLTQNVKIPDGGNCWIECDWQINLELHGMMDIDGHPSNSSIVTTDIP